MTLLPSREPKTKGSRLDDLDPALVTYLLEGDLRRAVKDLRARGQGILILWLKPELRALWLKYRVELEAEAKRRRVSPWWPRFDWIRGRGEPPDAA